MASCWGWVVPGIAVGKTCVLPCSKTACLSTAAWFSLDGWRFLLIGITSTGGSIVDASGSIASVAKTASCAYANGFRREHACKNCLPRNIPRQDRRFHRAHDLSDTDLVSGPRECHPAVTSWFCGANTSLTTCVATFEGWWSVKPKIVAISNVGNDRLHAGSKS